MGNNIRLIYRILKKKLPGEVFTEHDGWMLHAQVGAILDCEQLWLDFLPAASKKDLQSRLLMDFGNLIFI